MGFEVVRKTKEYKSEFLFGEFEERKEIKKDSGKLTESKEDILKKYIKKEEFKKALDGVNSSQLNRFYTILEGRNFSFNSNEIKKFVKEQIERNENSNSNTGTKEFYEFFQKNFLENNEFNSENKKNRVIFEMIKRYVRYSIGEKKLKEKK